MHDARLLGRKDIAIMMRLEELDIACIFDPSVHPATISTFKMS
jgi:hypothetical protein